MLGAARLTIFPFVQERANPEWQQAAEFSPPSIWVPPAKPGITIHADNLCCCLFEASVKSRKHETAYLGTTSVVRKRSINKGLSPLQSRNMFRRGNNNSSGVVEFDVEVTEGHATQRYRV
jgi:hypothetical protein